jgi:hypothetical protein
MLYGEHVKDALGRFEELERAADLAEGRADALVLGSGSSADEIEAQLAALPSGAPAALPAPSGGFGRKRAAS